MNRRAALAAAIALLIECFTAMPALAQQPASPAQVKPYKPVSITLPTMQKDAAFEAFRGKVADLARKKDRAGLAKLVVSKGFFWDRERGDGADKKKSGIDNLATALALNRADAAGWDMIASFADDPTVSPSPNHKGAMCAPGDPAFDRKAFGALLDATQTDVLDWGYTVNDGTEVRATPQASAATVEKLGLQFVRVLTDNSPYAAVTSSVKVATPSGQTGYIPADTIAPIGNDQVCYVKIGADWRIGGYVGAGEPQ